ncbi:MAG: ACT domain-containing protein [Christensenellales bacterium]|jgi:ACT domain-containing protein
MRAIVTVLGQDKPGIIAAVTTELAAAGVNVLDISQTLMQEYFVMVMLVELAGEADTLSDLQSRMEEVGKAIRVQIRLQREEIFQATNRI